MIEQSNRSAVISRFFDKVFINNNLSLRSLFIDNK